MISTSWLFFIHYFISNSNQNLIMRMIEEHDEVMNVGERFLLLSNVSDQFAHPRKENQNSASAI